VKRTPLKRGKRPKRVSAHQSLVKEADAWVKAIVIGRQGPECLKCNRRVDLQAAHILGKGANPAMRYELENVIGLCLRCHIFWGHKDPIAFTDWVEQMFPGRIAKLKLAAAQYRKIDLRELICVLKDIYKKESGGG
jgi:5-methylcytosine-specific restriction endonuclease McrA